MLVVVLLFVLCYNEIFNILRFVNQVKNIENVFKRNEVRIIYIRGWGGLEYMIKIILYYFVYDGIFNCYL